MSARSETSRAEGVATTSATADFERCSPARPADDAITVLEDLQLRGLLRQGKAHVVSLDVVRAAFGARWKERKTLVWDMMDVQIRRRIAAHDFTARLSDTDFLVITPTDPPTVARLLATEALREVLDHFLGKSGPADITIKVVSSFHAGELSCRLLSPDELAAISVEGPAPAAATWSAGDAAATTFDGRRLRFSASVAPIIDLACGAITGHRIEPKILLEDSRLELSANDRRQLLPRDVQAIDLSVLRRGLSRLSLGESEASRPSLIITVSFLSLSNTRARTELLAEANRSRALMTRAVIWEITDFEEGLPVTRLEECVAFLKPFCRSVFARALVGAEWSWSRAPGVSGLVVQPPVTMTREEDYALWLLSMGRVAAGKASTVVAANLPSTRLLPTAAAAGVTHATIRS